MKTKGKLLLILIVTIASLIMLTGCIPYSAKMYGAPYTNKSWMNEDFYESHLTNGAFSERLESYVEGDEYPEERIVKVTDQAQFDEIFKEFPEEVDFNKSMILMHCVTTASGAEYKIKNISLEDGVLTVEYTGKTELFPHPNASMPMTKWVIVVMDKIESNEVRMVFVP